MPATESQSCCPVEFRILSGDKLPEGDDVLEFRLLYEGAVLSASRINTRAGEKHMLRKEFHKQLKRLWETKYPLIGRTAPTIPRPLNAVNSPTIEGGFLAYRDVVADKFSYHGYKFVPIVTEDLFLTCSLAFLWLRPEEPKLLMQGGDLDNRIKTVFDSLRMPSVEEAAELKNDYPSEPDETPMYCLMQDDKLVAEIKVTADQLLLLPGTAKLKANDTFLVVHVRVKPTRLLGANIDFV